MPCELVGCCPGDMALPGWFYPAAIALFHGVRAMARGLSAAVADVHLDDQTGAPSRATAECHRSCSPRDRLPRRDIHPSSEAQTTATRSRMSPGATTWMPPVVGVWVSRPRRPVPSRIDRLQRTISRPVFKLADRWQSRRVEQSSAATCIRASPGMELVTGMDDISYAEKGAVGILTLNRPQVHTRAPATPGRRRTSSSLRRNHPHTRRQTEKCHDNRPGPRKSRNRRHLATHAQRAGTR